MTSDTTEIVNSGDSELVDVSEIEPHPDNPREGDVAEIAESIDENGFYGTLVVQESTGYILAGNHRYRAATEILGIEELPVAWVNCDEDRAKRIMLADNRTSDQAGYDKEALAEVLEDLADEDFETGSAESGLEGTGFNRDEMKQIDFELDPDFEPAGLRDQQRLDEKKEENKNSSTKECPNCGHTIDV